MKKKTKLISTLALVLLGNIYAIAQAVGDMGGVFNVNEMGAATYTQPFDLPAGINGMQPSLGLAYNSQSGNGVAGMGTSIYGTSVITRIPKDIYHDGTAKPITYTESDAYSIDGVRMVQFAQYDYIPENSPNVSITKNGSGTSQYFVIKTPDGNTSYYGQTSDSKANAKVPYAWYLNKVIDAHGNTITYTYTTDNGCVYLSKVTYGVNTVNFTYDSRPDAIPYIVNGVKCSIKKRLKSIAIKTNSTALNTYTLTYTNTDAFSLLTKIEESYGGTKLPATSFNWSKYTWASPSLLGASVIVDGSNYIIGEDDVVFAVDFTNDGYDDLVLIPKASNDVQYFYFCENKKSTSNLTFEKTSSYSTKSTYIKSGSSSYWSSFSSGCNFGDFDGDGYKEFVAMTIARNVDFYVYYLDGQLQVYGAFVNPHIDFAIIGRNGIKKTITAYLNTDWNAKDHDIPPYCINDFYNNGKSEILMIETVGSNKIYNIHISNSSGFTKSTITLPNKIQKLFASDFNSDGLQDIIAIYKEGYTIFWNQGVAEGKMPFSDASKTIGTNMPYAIMTEMGDFNGDGVADFLTNVTNADDWYFYFGNGDGTFQKQLAINMDVHDHNFTGKDNGRFSCIVLDFNHDGKDDVVITKAHYKKESNIWGQEWGDFKKTCTYWIKSTGSELELIKEASSTKASDAKDGHFTVGNFYGDGYAEIMNCGYDCYNHTNANVNASWHVYKNSNVYNATNKIASISTEKNGISTSISYAHITDNSIYTKGSGSSFPIADIQVPLNVVKQTTQNISANSYITKYSYTGLRAHMQGRGLLGFTTVKSTNSQTGKTVIRTINSLNTTFYEPSKVTVNESLGGKTSTTVTEMATMTYSGKVHFTYPKTITNTDIYGEKTTTTNTYQSGYYYLTKQRTEYGSSSMYKQVENSSFTKAGGVWQPKVVTTTQKHSDDGNAFSAKTTFEYNTTTGDVTKMVENASTTPLTHTYTYDSYGNVLTHNISGSGVTSATTTYTYDGTHRFVASEKSTANTLVTNYTYNTLGRLTYVSTGISGSTLTTSYTYDAIGNLTKITYPDGTSTSLERGWGSAAYQRYYVKSTTSGQAAVTTWYDDCGRERSSSTTGEKGVSVTSSTSYNSANGNVSAATNKIGNVSTTDNYTYNTLAQLTKASYGSGKTISYSYSKRSQSCNSGNHSWSQSFDLWGNVASSSENGASSVSYKYSSNGQPTTIKYSDAENQSFSAATMTYNSTGQQASLTDVDAGKTTYEYDALGRITKQTDARGNITQNYYNASGLLTSTVCGGVTTSYTYDSKLRLTKEATGSQSIAYNYDDYNRLKEKTYTIDGTTSLKFTYTYNSNGQLKSKTFPDGMTENYTYDSYGNLSCIKMGSTRVWELDSYNGTTRSAYLGTAPLTLTKSYSTKGLLTGTSIKNGSTTLHSFSYTIDGTTGNLTARTGMNGSESFSYDQFDRLTNAKVGSTDNKVTYKLTGNINSKTSLGTYSYDATKKHAVTNIANLKPTNQTVTYNAFNKVAKVETSSATLTITYGPNRQRVKTYYSTSGVTQTTLYADNYEQRTINGTVSTYHYVSSPDGLVAIYVKKGTAAMTPYYVETDHLGSICKIYNAAGTKQFDATYDAWGKQTVNYNTLGLTRGYCAHEHWNQFGLIDMNGRFYDPVVGRFLSPDPYVQDPSTPQNFNRYSYCLNNPLKYTDPSGEFWHIVIGAVVGGVVNVATHWKDIDNVWEGLGSFVLGAGAGAVTAATGGATSGFFATAGGAMVVGAGVGATTAAGNSVINQSDGNSFDNVSSRRVATAAGVGAVSGIVAYGLGSAINNTGVTNKIVDASGIGNAVAKNIVGSTITGAMVGAGSGLSAGITEGILTNNWHLGQYILNGLLGGATGGALYGGLTEIGYQMQLKNGYNKSLNSNSVEAVANGGPQTTGNLFNGPGTIECTGASINVIYNTTVGTTTVNIYVPSNSPWIPVSPIQTPGLPNNNVLNLIK